MGAVRTVEEVMVGPLVRISAADVAANRAAHAEREAREFRYFLADWEDALEMDGRGRCSHCSFYCDAECRGCWAERADDADVDDARSRE